MAIQRETHVCLIHVTTTDSVQFQDQVSIVLVPLVGRAKDAKVGNDQTNKQTRSKKLELLFHLRFRIFSKFTSMDDTVYF